MPQLGYFLRVFYLYKLSQDMPMLKIFACLIVVILVLELSFKQAKQQQIDWASKNFVIMLTMTIDPQGTYGAVRAKIADRINDYRKSLARWAELPYKVVIVESSGYGNPFVDILKDAKHITYVSVKTPHIPEKGKGYGESHLMRYALNNLILDNNIYIMKFTGRYAPKKDLSDMLTLLQLLAPNIVYRFGGTEWFVGRRAFFLELSDRCIATCRPIHEQTMWFERLFGRMVSEKYAMRHTKNIEVLQTFNGRNLPVTVI